MVQGEVVHGESWGRAHGSTHYENMRMHAATLILRFAATTLAATCLKMTDGAAASRLQRQNAGHATGKIYRGRKKQQMPPSAKKFPNQEGEPPQLLWPKRDHALPTRKGRDCILEKFSYRVFLRSVAQATGA